LCGAADSRGAIEADMRWQSRGRRREVHRCKHIPLTPGCSNATVYKFGPINIVYMPSVGEDAIPVTAKGWMQ
jgi:hypothetical protein